VPNLRVVRIPDASHWLQNAAGIATAYINGEILPLRSRPTALASSASLPPLVEMMQFCNIQ